MKKFITIILPLLAAFAKAESEDICWSMVKENIECCSSDNVKVIGKHMDGTWGEENGKKCGIRNKRYNWNLRDKYDETREEWEAFKVKWDNEYKNNFNRIALTPGADETQLNFGWESLTNIEPVIRISSDKNMKIYKDFIGKNEYYRELDGNKYYSNQVTTTGLKPNSVYYYQRKLDGKWEDVVEFNTYDSNDFKFVFVGDPQIGGSNDRLAYKSKSKMNESSIGNDAFNWNMTVNSFYELTGKPSLLLSAGDQADYMGGDKTQERQYSAYLLPDLIKKIPIAPALGNHEVYSESFRRHFNVPNPMFNALHYKTSYSAYNYYFKYNNVLVVVIESNYNTCHQCEKIISKAVKEYPDADWRIALFHHDLYGNGNTHSQGDAQRLRPCLTGLFDIHKFDLVINGHDHVYTSTHFVKFHDSQNKIYDIAKISKGSVNENPNGTFYVTANCSTGSKFLPFYEGELDYVFNYNQTFTSTFGVLDFQKSDGKVTLTINTYEVDTHDVVDGPYIFKKDERSLSSKKYDDNSFANAYGYPGCKSTTEIKYYDEEGSWGYENGTWCGIDVLQEELCWSAKFGYPCCKETTVVEAVDENGRWGLENGGRCGFIEGQNKELRVNYNKKCHFLDINYKCCTTTMTSSYEDIDGLWGNETNGEWCGIEEEEESYIKGYKWCSDPNTKRYPYNDEDFWGVENGNWCVIKNNTTTDIPLGDCSKYGDYKCCSKQTKLNYIDSTGIYGIVNTKYGVEKSNTGESERCVITSTDNECVFARNNIPCCKPGTKIEEIDEEGKRGIANAKYGINYGLICGIDETEKDTITTIIPTSTTPIPTSTETPTTCWSEPLGYPCCTGIIETEYTDKDGEWGLQNGDWCGITDENKKKCWSEPLGYPCCTGIIKTEYTDKDGEWGLQNGDWCGITDENKKKCWSEPLGYPCCTGNTKTEYTDKDGEWGLQNGDWCGINEDNTTPSTITTRRRTTTTTTTTTKRRTTTTTTTTTTRRKTTTTTTTTKKPSPTNEVCVPAFGQCGGTDYRGSTKCCENLRCVYLNDYYYQCQ
ncbi:Metallo-dependent phosphatase [Neocallimastix californiae]|uniref:Purple acid phosphatase n=1 Tax=Neocallimastix californiae TaxID=1754190 RepID=A0A1Y2A3U0_9FUNG|nr:Metallo-dependent phosphatase [Neocallimastix californiae]|eukprot:ORY17202.1 Metallo-dependent phosphatase [Neocallimastix californiae]